MVVSLSLASPAANSRPDEFIPYKKANLGIFESGISNFNSNIKSRERCHQYPKIECPRKIDPYTIMKICRNAIGSSKSSCNRGWIVLVRKLFADLYRLINACPKRCLFRSNPWTSSHMADICFPAGPGQGKRASMASLAYTSATIFRLYHCWIMDPVIAPSNAGMRAAMECDVHRKRSNGPSPTNVYFALITRTRTFIWTFI
jgi:hypothetical protein